MEPAPATPDDDSVAEAVAEAELPVLPLEPEGAALEQACAATFSVLFAGANVVCEPKVCAEGELSGDALCMVGLRGPRPAAVALVLAPSALRRLIMALRRCSDRLRVEISGLEAAAEREALVYGLARALAAAFVARFEPGEYTVLHPIALAGEGMTTQWSFERSWGRTVSIGGCEFDLLLGFDLPDTVVGHADARRAAIAAIRDRVAPPELDEDDAEETA